MHQAHRFELPYLAYGVCIREPFEFFMPWIASIWAESLPVMNRETVPAPLQARILGELTALLRVFLSATVECC
ncbi:hypothetical protein Misp06_01179 [Microbulbifer sp. NBRC 101763]